MKQLAKITGAVLMTALLLILPALAHGKQTSGSTVIQLDILYMNHGPMRPTINNLNKLLAHYPDSIQANWYDFDTRAGQKFMRRHGLKGHIPLLLMIDGRSRFTVSGRNIVLQGFPTGAGPFRQVEGNWSLQDLKTLLDSRVKQP